MELEQKKDIVGAAEDIEDLFKEDIALDDLIQSAAHAQKSLKRFLITVDATGSMERYWRMARESLRSCIGTIKENYHGQFAIKIVAYRDIDYTHEAVALEESQWTSNPKVLDDFIDSIRCCGGGDDAESLCTALVPALKNQCDCVVMIGDAGGKIRNQVDQTGAVEAEQLGRMGCPVFTFYITHHARHDFQRIADLSKGKCFKLESSRADVFADILKVVFNFSGKLGITYQPTSIEGKKVLEGLK